MVLAPIFYFSEFIFTPFSLQNCVLHHFSFLFYAKTVIFLPPKFCFKHQKHSFLGLFLSAEARVLHQIKNFSPLYNMQLYAFRTTFCCTFVCVLVVLVLCFAAFSLAFWCI